jgi:hypothetical protein
MLRCFVGLGARKQLRLERNQVGNARHHLRYKKERWKGLNIKKKARAIFEPRTQLRAILHNLYLFIAEFLTAFASFYITTLATLTVALKLTVLLARQMRPCGKGVHNRAAQRSELLHFCGCVAPGSQNL